MSALFITVTVLLTSPSSTRTWAEWTTPVDGWVPDGDRFNFTRGSAIWQLPEGPLNYLDFRMSAGGVRYNLAPEDIVPTSW